MKKKNYKVFVVARGMSNGDWIEGKRVSTIAEADIVVFTGGEDVSPALYGESNRITRSHAYVSEEGKLSSRDEYEIAAFKEAQSLGKVCWGNCRGTQLLTALAGGKLIQDVSHPSSHTLHMWDGELSFSSNSCHHQMAHPFNMKKEDYYVLASTYGLSRYHLDGNSKEMKLPVNSEGVVMEPEMLYYPRINALGFQGHAEWLDPMSTMCRVGHAFLNLAIEGQLEDALKIGLSSKDIFERAWDFKFTKEEQALVKSLNKVERTIEV